jgi:glycosyltransferase involved in cell wall biosynthesis
LVDTQQKKQNVFLSLFHLNSGGGAEEQIQLHLKALRANSDLNVSIVCGKDSTITGDGIVPQSSLGIIKRRGMFISYLSHDHLLGFIRKLFMRGRWIPFERTHPSFYEAIGRDSLVRRWKHRFQILAFRHFADALMVQTSSARDAWLKKMKSWPQEKIHVVPNIYLVQKERKIIEGRVPRLIMVGRLISIKDYPLAFEAFGMLKMKIKFQVDIYGVGPEDSNLKQSAQQLHLDDVVNFKGFVASKDDIYENADLLVMTSLFEGSPNAIGEAMSFGLPIVTLNFEAGPKDILGGLDHNQIVTSRSPALLAELILKHLGSQKWSKEIGLANQNRISKNYSDQEFSKKFLDALHGGN